VKLEYEKHEQESEDWEHTADFYELETVLDKKQKGVYFERLLTTSLLDLQLSGERDESSVRDVAVSDTFHEIWQILTLTLSEVGSYVSLDNPIWILVSEARVQNVKSSKVNIVSRWQLLQDEHRRMDMDAMKENKRPWSKMIMI